MFAKLPIYSTFVALNLFEETCFVFYYVTHVDGAVRENPLATRAAFVDEKGVIISSQ